MCVKWQNNLGGNKMKFELTGYNIDTLLQTLYNKKILLRNINRIAYNKVVFDVDDKFEKKVKRYIANYKVEKTKSFFKRIPAMLLVNLGVIIGGLLFGVAFGFIGSCPGTCVGAMGSGELKKAISIIIGGLVGAFVYSLSYGYFKGFGLFETLDILITLL